MLQVEASLRLLLTPRQEDKSGIFTPLLLRPPRSLMKENRNFELPRVKSINASGHKYGLVYVGLGWVIWRDESYLPKHLIFELHYLGGTELTYTLNFSRPGAQVPAQYYNLIHLGFNGYREIAENCLANARLLSKALEATGWYTCVSDIHRPAPSKHGTKHGTAEKVKSAVSSAIGGDSGKSSQGQDSSGGKASATGETSADYTPGLPVVSFRFSDEFRKEYPHMKQEKVSLLMRARQWIIPNYALPPTEDDTEILRVVIRESMSFDLLDKLITDLVLVTEHLMEDDQIDLSVLTKLSVLKKLRRPLTEERKKPKEKAPEEKRMADGIHSSVC